MTRNNLSYSLQPFVVLIYLPIIWFLCLLCYPILWFFKIVESSNREPSSENKKDIIVEKSNKSECAPDYKMDTIIEKASNSDTGSENEMGINVEKSNKSECAPDNKMDTIVEKASNSDTGSENEMGINVEKLKKPLHPDCLTLKLQPLKDLNLNSNLYFVLLAVSSCPKFVEDIKTLRLNYKTGLEKLCILKELIMISNGETGERLRLSSNRIFKRWNKLSQPDIFESLEHILNKLYYEIRKYKEDKKEISIGNFQKWANVLLPMRIIYEYRIYCKCGNPIQGFLQSDFAIHLQVSMKNEKEVECLQDFVDSSFVDDPITEYKCDKADCQGKNIMKYIRVQRPLPRTLCIHLQPIDSIKPQVKFNTKLIIKSKFSTSDHLQADIDDELNMEKEAVLNSNQPTQIISGRNRSNPYPVHNLSSWQHNHRQPQDQNTEDSDDVFELVSLLTRLKGPDDGDQYDCYRRINKKWFHINDYQMIEVETDQIFSREVSLLFYEKIEN